jgi:hypothetical protein
MPHDDSLIELLRTADAAASTPSMTGDLSARVRRRRAAKIAKVWRIRIGVLAGAVVMLVAVSLRITLFPGGRGQGAGAGIAKVIDHGTDIVQLRADADALAAEVAALEHELALTRGFETRQQLREEHQTQLAVQLERQSSPNSLDRAALVGISQGDFYRDVRQSLNEARAAYESVVDYFPESQWAALAQTRINQLQMN